MGSMMGCGIGLTLSVAVTKQPDVKVYVTVPTPAFTPHSVALPLLPMGARLVTVTSVLVKRPLFGLSLMV